MKRLLGRVLISATLLLSGIVAAHAVIVTDSVEKNFRGDGRLYGASYEAIMGCKYDKPFSYTLEYTAPLGSILQSASLSIRHLGNASSKIFFFITNHSNWEVTLDGASFGNLDQSPTDGGWVTNNFDLSGILNTITDSTPWSLTVSLQNTTDWDDVLMLDKSVLSLTYRTPEEENNEDNNTEPTPVPEPATMLLLGTGLLAGFGKMTFRRKA